MNFLVKLMYLKIPVRKSISIIFILHYRLSSSSSKVIHITSSVQLIIKQLSISHKLQPLLYQHFILLLGFKLHFLFIGEMQMAFV